MVLLHGGSFSMTIRSRGSGQIGIPWSGQMGIDEHNKSSFDMVGGTLKLCNSSHLIVWVGY